MNDLAWLQFLGGVSMYLAMPIAVAVAALLDRRPEPPFPRWCGYTNIWLMVMILPDQMLFSDAITALANTPPSTA